ncbi:MAG: hypothetical protein JSV17_17120 [Candidatus Aminicenantes bacterium]|nr:MAG: hypothetical protein JSV17_17120 [Candidatus Aminicenantes bacterium]
MKKFVGMMIVLFLGSTFTLSQDLVKVGQKEKERRMRLKKKSAIIVTNADLEKTNREAALRIAPSEDQPQNVQRTIPSKPSSSSKRQPSRQIDIIDQMDISMDKVDQLDQTEARGFRSDYAIQVSSSNELVRNPELALKKPDGRFAELSILGTLDLEISAINGPGDDIAIHARQTGAKEILPGGEEEGGIPELSVDFQYWEGLWYGVLTMDEQGEWIALGKGTGTKGPENFGLGDLSSIKKLRIMFRPHSNADRPVKFIRRQPIESTFGIDAIESLHR